MKTAQDFAREAVEKGIISSANESELELLLLHYMEELLKHWYLTNVELNLDYNLKKAMEDEPECYYNDELCSGKISYVPAQDGYLCENCIKEINSIKD